MNSFADMYQAALDGKKEGRREAARQLRDLLLLAADRSYSDFRLEVQALAIRLEKEE